MSQNQFLGADRVLNQTSQQYNPIQSFNQVLHPDNTYITKNQKARCTYALFANGITSFLSTK